MIPVADAAGEVVEVGRDVTRFRAGDRIITHYATRWLDGEGHVDDSLHTLGNTISGALAEYIVLDEQAAVAKPDYLSDEEASTLPVAALTAWYALAEKGHLKEGQTVLIQGTGGVSIFGLQLATALGAQTIVTSSSDEKLVRAKSLGAAHGINYSRVTKKRRKNQLQPDPSSAGQSGGDQGLPRAAGADSESVEGSVYQIVSLFVRV
jgi:NADPH:quinone reductase-like Zn-dependent oxidoreductase